MGRGARLSQGSQLGLQLALGALVEYGQQLQAHAPCQPDAKLFPSHAVDAQQHPVLFADIADVDLMNVHASDFRRLIGDLGADRADLKCAGPALSC